VVVPCLHHKIISSFKPRRKTEVRTLTNALGLKPTSEKAAAAKEVAPKYTAYLAVAGMLFVPTSGFSANAM